MPLDDSAETTVLEDSRVVHRLVSAIDFGVGAQAARVRLDRWEDLHCHSGPIGSAPDLNSWHATEAAWRTTAFDLEGPD
jgi:hypothetical protein